MDPKNKVFWEEFIEIYRQNSCMWEVKSKDYSNKMKRNSSYEVLLRKLPGNIQELLGEMLVLNLRSSYEFPVAKYLIEWQSTFLQHLLNFSCSFALKFCFLLIPIKICMYRYPFLDNLFKSWGSFSRNSNNFI
jgi:hypothetical protein